MQQPTNVWCRHPQGAERDLSSTAVLGPRGFGRQGRKYVRTPRRGVLTVEDALTKEQKKEIVEKLRTNLETSTMVFGMRMKGLTVVEVQKLKSSMPKETRIVMCKNTLMRIACNEVSGMKPLEEFCKGDNAWVFTPEAAISETVKAWFEFEDELRTEKQANLPKGQTAPPVTEVTGGCMEGKALSSDDVKNLEGLPTKKELMARLAVALRMIPTRIAMGIKPDRHLVRISAGIKQIPRQLATAAKAVSELDDDKSKLVKDVAKPKEA